MGLQQLLAAHPDSLGLFAALLLFLLAFTVYECASFARELRRDRVARLPAKSDSSVLPHAAGEMLGLPAYEFIELPPAGAPLAPRRPPRLAPTVGACLVWVGASNALILLNKYLMWADGFRHPMALSSLGMLASWLLSVAACRLGFVRATHRVSRLFFITRLFPVGLAMASMFYFGNRAYLYITVSFVQMLKTATPVVTMAVMVLFRLERARLHLVIALLLLVAGTALSSFGELAFSWTGVLVMLLSEVADALRLVLTQLLLSSSAWHPIEALMYLAPSCALCLLTGVFLVEWEAMQREHALAKVARRPALYLLTAVLGFVCNAAQTIVIKKLSSLSLKVIGVTANSLLVVCSTFLFGDRLSAVQVVGYAISFVGFVLYNVLKSGERDAYRKRPHRLTSHLTSVHIHKS
ncbi:hypothetical protein AB1Y20_012995 [Prymnesium parvum]|uniref:Sugar phosphate transporter domain-containing protein n=1 Tax=Prymnesium parvum TaxID=97485 RepID=A0AB34ILW2_PRYPA